MIELNGVISSRKRSECRSKGVERDKGLLQCFYSDRQRDAGEGACVKVGGGSTAEEVVGKGK